MVVVVVLDDSLRRRLLFARDLGGAPSSFEERKRCPARYWGFPTSRMNLYSIRFEIRLSEVQLSAAPFRDLLFHLSQSNQGCSLRSINALQCAREAGI